MKLKKLASLAMTGVLCVSMLAACGGGSSSSAAVSGSAASGSASAEGTGNVTPVGEYPIVNEPITFKIMGAQDPGAPDWSELEVFQRLSEITNINFEFEVSETGTWPEPVKQARSLPRIAEGARRAVAQVPEAYRPRLVEPPAEGGPTVDDLLRPPARSRN